MNPIEEAVCKLKAAYLAERTVAGLMRALDPAPTSSIPRIFAVCGHDTT
jgi:hypothetical protein